MDWHHVQENVVILVTFTSYRNQVTNSKTYLGAHFKEKNYQAAHFKDTWASSKQHWKPLDLNLNYLKKASPKLYQVAVFHHLRTKNFESIRKRKGRNQMTGEKSSTKSTSSSTNIAIQPMPSTLLCKNSSP